MPRFRQIPLKPRLNRGKGLFRHCIFAYRAGWDKGFHNGGIGTDSTAAREQVWGTPLNFAGSVDPTNYPTEDMGRSLDEGPGASSIIASIPNVQSHYTVTQGFTAAILMRPSFIFNNEELVFGWLDNVVPNQGWGINASFTGDANPNGYHFQINNGAPLEFSAANLQNTALSALLIIRYNPFGPNKLEGWFDGKLVGSIGGTGGITNWTGAVRLFGEGAQPNFCLGTSMAAIWNIPLPDSSLDLLHSDPYALWRSKDADIGSQFPGIDGMCDCCCPCCGAVSPSFFGMG
jgi:hypothetical protein